MPHARVTSPLSWDLPLTCQLALLVERLPLKVLPRALSFQVVLCTGRSRYHTDMTQVSHRNHAGTSARLYGREMGGRGNTDERAAPPGRPL